MAILHIDLKNCYGIGSLKHDIDFKDDHPTAVIYAPNGTMKTSFTRTIQQLLAGKDPCDELYKDRVSSWDVTIDGSTVSKKNTYVFANDDIDATKQISTFLADAALRKEYNAIYGQLEGLKKNLKNQIKALAHSSDCEDEIQDAFRISDDENYFDCLLRIKEQLANGEETIEFDFPFNDVFEEGGKVREFIEKNQSTIQQYFEKYTELVSNSSVFSSGPQGFGTSQANTLLKSVNDNRFFHAQHKIQLRDAREVLSSSDMSSVIKAELDRILTDADIEKLFKTLEDNLQKNAELRGFKDVIQAYPELIPELVDYDAFEKKVLRGYARRCQTELDSLTALYESNKDTLCEIIKRANESKSQWEQVVDLFNLRFIVPFRLRLNNKSDILLNSKSASLLFEYSDGGDLPIIEDRKELVEHLSQGEKKAFFILQNIFELEARKAKGQDTLLIFDDVADSFDYKNKYAIVEYLYDLATDGHFKILVLTHNFDFYRTVVSRLKAGHVYFAHKAEDRTVELKRGIYQQDILKRKLLSKLTDRRAFIGCIPFVRNIVEYTKGMEEDYKKLTSCLHQKDDTPSIKMSEIMDIFRHTVKEAKDKTISFGGESYLDALYEEAETIMTDPNEIDIVNKLVLSIAIRHKAEAYMKSQLSAEQLAVVASSDNQTGALYDRFKTNHAGTKEEECRLMNQVLMHTSENIHLNNFMFEPLVDISAQSLQRVYKNVKAL